MVGRELTRRWFDHLSALGLSFVWRVKHLVDSSRYIGTLINN